MNLIKINDEIFIIWVFHSWLEMMLLTLKGYWHNSNYINCAKLIDIEYVQLKPLTFKNDLILVSILEVPFIVEVIISIADENISDIVNCFWSIDDIEIELWEKLIPAGLMAVQLAGDDEVFQIFMINEHDYRVSDTINFKMLFFKCFNNDQ